MQKTRKLYDENAYCEEFCAHVLACTPENGKFLAMLDQTAFYPEGGGQPADHGALGGARVLDVQEKDGIIYHTLSAPVRVGEVVQGNIDFARRMDHMQQHTGEHLVSGIVHSQYGYDNVGFHIGSDAVTVDFSGPLTSEELTRIENAANWYIYRNQPVTASYPEAEVLAATAYRSKKALTGAVRLVQVGTADSCACCGTHVRSTGELGMIKIVSGQSYKGGVRVTMLCGQRAAQDYAAKCAQNAAISTLLSAKPNETAAAVQRLLEENAVLKTRLTDMETKLCTFTAAAYKGKSNPVLFLTQEPQTADSVRRMALALCAVCTGVCSVFGGNDASGYKYALASADGTDVRPTAQALQAHLAARGGGKPQLAQGSVAAAQTEIEKALNA